jgi:acyl carrier protein
MNESEHSILKAIELVHDQMGFSKRKLTPQTRLFHDLAIDGDDAVELLMALNEQYGVSCEDFNFSNYFGAEIGAGWRHLGWRIFHNNDQECLKPITILDLAWAIENKKLIGPEERNK